MPKTIPKDNMPKTIPKDDIQVTDIPVKPKSKRGRKSKAELMASLNIIPNIITEATNIVVTEPNIMLSIEEPAEVVKSPLKKRGRKPKGGKIVQQVTTNLDHQQDKPNVILHLKCSTKDLSSYNNCDVDNYSQNNTLPFEFIAQNENDDLIKTYCNTPNEIINYTEQEQEQEQESCDESIKQSTLKELWKKLKQLEHSLHTNNINDKKSACFWCTCDFDNPPIYIPKYYMGDSYQVYGCFCSPECAVASLMTESIDSSTKFERYHFLNHIYAKIFNYSKNIKPAPNPYYMLDKYYGNLTTQEYRSLLRNERLFLIVDKPLTRILPELHEDNDDFILNNKIIPSNNYQLKKRLQKNNNKTNILNETFGLNNV